MAKTYSIKTVFEVFDRAARPLQKIGTAFSGIAKKVNTVSKSLDKAGKKMDDIGKKMSTRLTLPIVGFAAASAKASMDFNEAMANIATLIPGNIKRVKELKKGVQDMAVSVGKSTGDLADGLYQVVSAFGDSSDAIKILETNAKAATAGLSTTMDAINLTSAVTKAYGDTTAGAVKKAADLGLLTVRLGQTTFPELAASIGRVTPLASQLGVKQEELFSGFATLTGVTGGAAEVSTQMAAILRAMLKPTEDMTKASKKLGFESASQMIKQKGLVESLKLLMKYTKGDEQATAKLFGRAEALTAVFSLGGPLAEKYSKSLNEMSKSAGTLDQAFKEVTDGINKNGFSWKRFISLLQVVGQEIGDTLGPLLVDIIGVLREWIQKFRALSPEGRKMVLVIAGIVAAIGPALMIFGKLSMGLGFVAKALTITTAAGTPLLLIFGKIALAVGVVAGAVYGLEKAFNAVEKALGGEGLVLLGNLLSAIPGIGAGLQSISRIKALRAEERKNRTVESQQAFSPEGMKQAIANQGQLDLNVKVSAEPGSSAMIDKVKRKGKSKVKLNNTSSFGATFSPEGSY